MTASEVQAAIEKMAAAREDLSANVNAITLRIFTDACADAKEKFNEYMHDGYTAASRKLAAEKRGTPP